MALGRLFGGVRRLSGTLVRLLASWKLTIVLLALVAAALVCATALEAATDRECAQWYIYRSPWLLGLLGMLAANLAAALMNYFPWRWNRAGLVIAHVGALILLAGFIQTFVEGIEGRLILRKGENARSVDLTHRSQLRLLLPRGAGVETTELCFSPGPADWRSDQPLDFGEVGGTTVKVLRFYRHARYQSVWGADETGLGKPAIQVAVSDSLHPEAGERWCAPTFFDRPPIEEKTNVSFRLASVSSLRDDFLQPPPVMPGSRGILSVHHKDRVYRIPVDGNTGKNVPVGDSGLTVEIVGYYANAKISKEQYKSEGAEPKNPMLQLRVHAPGQKQPIPEVAYANRPFVNFGAIHRKQECPVKFWYHHPAVKALSGVEFLQTPDGKLYCRVGAGGVFQPRGEVHEGDRITVSPECQITLLRYLLHARSEMTFTPIEPAPGETMQAEAAALVELTTAGKSDHLWLRRNDARLGVQRLQAPGGPLMVMFGYERQPLGFFMKLVDCHRDGNPDSRNDASCVSHVQLFEGAQDADVISANNPLREISTINPLRYGTITFYQSGVQQFPGNGDLSVLRVTSDPGRVWKYLGCAMICGGILLLVILRLFGKSGFDSSGLPPIASEVLLNSSRPSAETTNIVVS